VYPGGKNACYQQIINLMPPHRVYIEPFLGSGAVMRMKRPAELNIGLDLDEKALAITRNAICNGPASSAAGIAKSSVGRRRGASNPPMLASPGTNGVEDLPGTNGVADRNARSGVVRSLIVQTDGLEFLRSGYTFQGDELVYCDPPYLMGTRSSGPLYRFEFTDSQHSELLEIVRSLPCMVLVSGYHSALYGAALKDWNSIHFQAMTRGGKMATEWVWFNYPEPIALHDIRYLGSGFRERERIKRKKQRWVNRLEAMPILERRSLLSAIAAVWGPSILTSDGGSEIGGNSDGIQSPDSA
jgi:DNA adenine methylase